jgi:hypothetical protein
VRSSEKYYTLRGEGRTDTCKAMKVPRQCPFVFLIEVERRELGSGEVNRDENGAKREVEEFNTVFIYNLQF